MTEIKIEGKKISFVGHADSIEDCSTFSAVAEALKDSESFKTLKYEKGKAVFEQLANPKASIFPPTTGFSLYVYSSIGEIGIASATYSGSINTASNNMDLQWISGSTYYFGDTSEGVSAGETVYIDSITTPTKEGYTFDGFYADSGFLNKITFPYAAWTCEEISDTGAIYIYTKMVQQQPLTPKQQFESDMASLAQAIDTKAGTTGGGTVSQLKTKVDGIEAGGVTPLYTMQIGDTPTKTISVIVGLDYQGGTNYSFAPCFKIKDIQANTTYDFSVNMYGDLTLGKTVGDGNRTVLYASPGSTGERTAYTYTFAIELDESKTYRYLFSQNTYIASQSTKCMIVYTGTGGLVNSTGTMIYTEELSLNASSWYLFPTTTYQMYLVLESAYPD